LFNSTWENSLTWINEHTPPDSIIDTWWPPGHFIKAIAKRRVLFDGATINNPKGYWLANALLATSEQEALAFLRLANNDCIQAVMILREAGLTDSQTVSVLKSLIRLPEQDALTLASQKLDGDKAKTLIAITHKDPGPVYLMVYNEMMENFLLYPFVARWNFEKVEQINADPQLRARIPKAGSLEYINFLWDISGGNPKISNILSAAGQQGSQIVFAENLVVDLAEKTCRIKSGKYGTGIPMFLFYEENGQVRSLPLSGGNLPYAVVVGKRHGQYQARLLEIALAQSFLTRLYFFGDMGLNHVKLVRQDKNITGKMQIDVFKIE
ncbi:MAG TPA: hypothetical protein VLJ10_03225, partial [Candidatus Bathyarchaeia archaeon]|nr:hypothetical protein [Candidatus Bathyarchaeia archaeon]